MRLFTLFFVLILSQTQAQHNHNSMKISAADLPPAVLETFRNNYPSSTVKQWEKLTYHHEQVAYNKYVAVMPEEGLITRARFKEDGLALTATTYYKGKHRNKLPGNIKSYATTNFPKLKLIEVEKILLFEDNSTYYRLFLQKNVEYKFIYLNLAGILLEEDSIPSEVREDDAWARDK